MTFSLRNKTIVSIAAIEAALLILLIFTAVNFMRDTLNDDLVKRSSTVATLFATTTKNAVLTYDLASLETYCSELLKNPDVAYVRIVNSKNQVLAQAGQTDLLAREFIQDDQVDTVTDGIFDNFATIIESGHVYGRVELGLEISNIEISIEKIKKWTTGIALIEMLLVALFSYVLGNYLTQRLQKLRRAVGTISKHVESGEFNQPQLPVSGKDELADVTKAFNKLIVTLDTENERKKAYQQELEQLNQTLEQKVIKRTKLLNQRNEQLEEKNRQLNETQQQLVQAEKMASIGQLAAGVAHEINNPVGFIGSNLGSLQQYSESYRGLVDRVRILLSTEDVSNNEPALEALQQWLEKEDFDFIVDDTKELIDESIDGLRRVANISNDLKQFSRADSEEKQWIDLNTCIETTLKMVNTQLKYHCQIDQSLSQLPKIWVNSGKINQVLTNLLINAGQAIDEKGLITISSRLHNESVEVVIEDNGSGISPNNLTKLFDPFFTTKDVGTGTGLGLSISYGIIQEHGGDITVTSELGKGSRFCITLPTATDKENII